MVGNKHLKQSGFVSQMRFGNSYFLCPHQEKCIFLFYFKLRKPLKLILKETKFLSTYNLNIEKQ